MLCLRRYCSKHGNRFCLPDMTYARFLLLFLCLPTVAIFVGLRGRIARHHATGLVLVNLLAFVYTTPWDNFAAYKKLWIFAPAFVWGKPWWFGYVPMEEYLFYFAEAVFVCLTMLALQRIKFLQPGDTNAVR